MEALAREVIDHTKMNRKLIIVWLENYQDLYGKKSYGLINFEELGKPGPSVPLSPVNLEYLDSHIVYASHQRLHRALELIRDGWPLYYDYLHALYVSDDPSPQMVDEWQERSQREGHLMSKRHLRLRAFAIDKMNDLVGKEAIVLDERLASGEGRTEYARERAQERLKCQRHYLKKREEGVPKTRAAKETAQDLKVAISSVYLWTKEIR